MCVGGGGGGGPPPQNKKKKNNFVVFLPPVVFFPRLQEIEAIFFQQNRNYFIKMFGFIKDNTVQHEDFYFCFFFII